MTEGAVIFWDYGSFSILNQVLEKLILNVDMTYNHLVQFVAAAFHDEVLVRHLL